VATIQAAVAQGLTVMVRPLIDFLGDDAQATYTTDQYGNPIFAGTTNPYGDGYGVDEYRADYTPTTPAQVTNVFSSYQAILDQEAMNAMLGGATLMSIGAELNPALTSATYLPEWTQIIQSIRAIDPNLKLTYSASADYYSPATGTVDPAATVSFWNQLDYAGADVYTPLANAVAADAPNGDPTFSDLVQAWETTPAPGSQTADATGGLSPIAYLESIQQISGKPLLLTEIGYQNMTSAAYDPTGEVAPSGVPDPTLQQSLDQAFFQAWRDSGYTAFAGAYFWNWDALENDGNSDEFSPENNPGALAAVTSGFAAADAALTDSPPVVFTNLQFVAPNQTLTATAGNTGTGALSGDYGFNGSALTVQPADPSITLQASSGDYVMTSAFGQLLLNPDGSYSYTAFASDANLLNITQNPIFVDVFNVYVVDEAGTSTLTSLDFEVNDLGFVSSSSFPSSKVYNTTMANLESPILDPTYGDTVDITVIAQGLTPREAAGVRRG
jgi:VCBS repeat-containing protein